MIEINFKVFMEWLRSEWIEFYFQLSVFGFRKGHLDVLKDMCPKSVAS